MKFLNIIGFILISFLISGCASKSMSERADWIVKKVERKLELDKMQAAKLWAIKHKYFEIRDGKKSERDGSFKTLTSFITSDDFISRSIFFYQYEIWNPNTASTFVISTTQL